MHRRVRSSVSETIQNVEQKMIRIGSLFSGIGGFELGLERAIPNSTTLWQVEQDKFCQRILQKHWPNATIYNDVKNINKHNVAPIDILCGGFPCQDISIAGKGAGINDGKKSSLWWEMHRIINELRPRVAVLENVPAITFRGGQQVVGSLAQIGYDAEWIVISAQQFGAPHKRERWFCVAYPVGLRCNGRKNTKQQDTDSIHQEWHTEKGEQQWSERISWPNENTIVAYPNSDRLEKESFIAKRFESKGKGIWSMPIGTTDSQQNVAYPNSENTNDTTTSSICLETEIATQEWMSIGCDNSNSNQYSTGTGYWRSPHPEPLIRRVDDGVSRRLDSPRLKALGNAIVPQCSEWIGKQIWESGLLL